MSTSRSSASPSPDRPWFPRFPSGTGRRHARSPCFVLRPALFLYSSSQRLFSRRVMRAATPLIRVLQSTLVPSQRVLRGEILFSHAVALRSGSLFQHMNLVHCQSLESFRQPAQPANLHPIDLCCRSQPKMNAHVVLRIVARSASHFDFVPTVRISTQ